MPRRSCRPDTTVSARRARAERISALDAGLRLLARRAHSRREIWQKLSRRGYTEDDVQGAIARLVELGYLDDAAFAESHVRRRSSSLGPMALGAELAAKGVDRSVAGDALTTFDPGAQVVAAARLAERLCARTRPAGYRELLDTVGSKLVRRGFSTSVAREACRVVWAGTAGAVDA